MARKKILLDKEEIDEVVETIRERLYKRLEKRKSFPYYNRHEALGKIAEEYDEFVFAVRKQKKKNIQEESLDVAEACLYLLASTKHNKI